MKKEYYTYETIHDSCLNIIEQLKLDKWTPDYIVGITRGGLVPSVIISQVLNIKMFTLHVSLRDHSEDNESNCWMSNDAYDGKNILIVDDINDTGATITWIKNDWQRSCYPKNEKWNSVWGNNVRFATITNNESSNESVQYSANDINKSEENVWIVYPWEIS